ncbi:MAG: redoxin domain-containing protein [Candidatus Nanohalobium sp.]
MVESGEKAPELEGLRIVEGELEEFKLSEEISNGPVVMAFFPAAFSPPCTNELVSIQDKLEEFEEENAEVVAVSVDNPFAVHAFKEDEGFEFKMVSDNTREGVEAFDVKEDIQEIDLHDVANRSVFVIDENGEITYKWEAENNLSEKCMDEVLEILRHVRENY